MKLGSGLTVPIPADNVRQMRGKASSETAASDEFLFLSVYFGANKWEDENDNENFFKRIGYRGTSG